MISGSIAVSILQFYLQCFHPSEDMLAAEETAVSRLFRGPRHWASRSLLQVLKVQLGAPYDLPDIQHIGWASKMRLRMAEDFLRRD